MVTCKKWIQVVVTIIWINYSCSGCNMSEWQGMGASRCKQEQYGVVKVILFSTLFNHFYDVLFTWIRNAIFSSFSELQ